MGSQSAWRFRLPRALISAFPYYALWNASRNRRVDGRSRGDGNMSHLIRPVSVRPVAAKLTDLLISDSIGHAIGRGAFAGDLK